MEGKGKMTEMEEKMKDRKETHIDQVNYSYYSSE